MVLSLILGFFGVWVQLYEDFVLGLWWPSQFWFRNEATDLFLLVISTLFLVVSAKHFKIYPRFRWHMLVSLGGYVLLMRHVATENSAKEEYAIQRTSRYHPVVKAMGDFLTEQGVGGPDEIIPLSLVQFFTKIIGAKRVIEIGTKAGLVSLAEAVVIPGDGHVTTLVAKDSISVSNAQFWARANISTKVDMRIGELADVLKRLKQEDPQPYDVAFINAELGHHPWYFQVAMGMVRPGGMIFIKNGFVFGEVKQNHHDSWEVRSVASFNKDLASDPRVSVLFMAHYNGLSMILKH